MVETFRTACTGPRARRTFLERHRPALLQCREKWEINCSAVCLSSRPLRRNRPKSKWRFSVQRGGVLGNDESGRAEGDLRPRYRASSGHSVLSRCKVPEPEDRHPRRFELSVLEPEPALMISPKANVGLARRRDTNLNRRHRHFCKPGWVSVREWLQRGRRHVGRPARSHWPDCGPVPSKAGSRR